MESTIGQYAKRSMVESKQVDETVDEFCHSTWSSDNHSTSRRINQFISNQNEYARKDKEIRVILCIQGTSLL